MAVYTEVSDEDLIGFLTHYAIGDLVSYRGIAEGVENTNWCVSAFSVAVPDTTCIVQSPPVLATAPVSVAPAPAVTESGPPCALVTSIVSVQLAPCRVLKSPTAPGTVRSAPWNLAM